MQQAVPIPFIEVILAADVAALQDDAVGINGNLTTAATAVYVGTAVADAIDDLDDLSELEF